MARFARSRNILPEIQVQFPNLKKDIVEIFILHSGTTCLIACRILPNINYADEIIESRDLEKFKGMFNTAFSPDENADFFITLLNTYGSQIAINFFTEDWELDVKNLKVFTPEELVNFGDVCLSLGDLNGAARAYEYAIQLDPEYEIALYNLGVTRQKLRNLDGAIQMIEKALNIDPQQSEWWVTLGILRQELGNLLAAFCAYTRAIKSNINLVSAWINLGRAFAQNCQDGEALYCWEQALLLGDETCKQWTIKYRAKGIQPIVSSLISNLYKKNIAHQDNESRNNKKISPRSVRRSLILPRKDSRRQLKLTLWKRPS